MASARSESTSTLDILQPYLSVLVVFSNWTYPGQEGLHLQSAAVLRKLCERGIRVHIIALARQPELLNAEQLRTDWGAQVSITVLPTRLNYPLLLAHSALTPARLDSYWQAVTTACNEFKPNLIHFEGIGLAPWLRHAIPADTPVLMSTVDAWSLRQSRLAVQGANTLPKRLFLRAYAAISRWVEARFFPLATAVHVVSADDAIYLQQLCPSAQVKVVPVGLMTVPTTPRTPRHATQVIFWGDIGVPHLRTGLLWLLKDVWPKLPEELRTRVHLEVLGRREPDSELLTASRGIPVTFRQWVPDVDELLRQAAVVLLPDASGSGMKNRTLQAMVNGTPVIGTRYAFEGIAAKNGEHGYVADTSSAFAEAIQQVLSDAQAAQYLGNMGRQLALDTYGMDAVVSAWQDLYQLVQGSKI